MERAASLQELSLSKPLLTTRPPHTLTTSDCHCLLSSSLAGIFPKMILTARLPKAVEGSLSLSGLRAPTDVTALPWPHLRSPYSVSTLAGRFAYASSCHLPSGRRTWPRDVHFKEGK